jgi:hypothetical protein
MAQQLSRRHWLRLAGALVAGGLTSACQVGRGPAAAPTSGASASTGGASLVIGNSELVVGPNRFVLGLLENGRPIGDAQVHLAFFALDGQAATMRQEADAVYRTAAGTDKGLYVSRVSFDQPGDWGVQVSATRPGQAALSGRASFKVQAEGSAPTPGMRAIASQSLTQRDVANLSDICSAQPPCDMHQQSIAAALANHRPLMIAFATPGYCTSQTCAPVLGEVQKVKQRRGSEASFVHVEIYKDPRNLVVADTVEEWHLQSEPWAFVVDRDGVIQDRIESVTNADELEASLANVL